MNEEPSTQMRHAPAAVRNRDAIAAALPPHMPTSGLVLEIGSGTGQHAVHMAAAFPNIIWQPSDQDPGARDSIEAWSRETGQPNVRPPLALDAAAVEWPISHADAMFSANVVHISPWAVTTGIFRGAARILPPEAPLLLYGPFRHSGRHIADSNVKFDQELRSTNPAWGIRDLDDLRAEASVHGCDFDQLIPMPANNHIAVFHRRKEPRSLA